MYNRNGDPKLPRMVVNAIRTHMNNHTLTGWVKQETLADYTGLSVRQVRRQIDANVKAGWLEVTSVGNSSGLASSYRLTLPKADMDVRIGSVSSVKADTDVPLKADIYDREGGHECPVKADMDVRPTTPITSPGSSPKRRTTPEKADMDVRIPDPFGGSGDYLPATTTSESNADMDVRLGTWDIPLPVGDPWPQHVTPWPRDKPLPTGRDFDPYATYVDDQTGEPLPRPA